MSFKLMFKASLLPSVSFLQTINHRTKHSFKYKQPFCAEEQTVYQQTFIGNYILKNGYQQSPRRH